MILKAAEEQVPLPAGQARVGGFLGEKLDTCIRAGVMAVDPALYAAPFRDQTDDGGGWGGEFWGKWFTSAALAARYQPTPEHRAVLDGAVATLLQAQEPSGRLSSYKRDLGEWDAWGRKYALLGLLAYYDLTGSPEALQAAARAADHLMALTGPEGTKLTETGLAVLEALSSASVLEPIALLYQRTGEQAYLDYALRLVALWSEPNRYTAKGIRLVESALAGMEPARIASPKAYEMMSCYEGLCELYRATSEPTYLAAAVRFATAVREQEIMIVGSGSSAELWCGGAARQTMLLEQPMETCVTATWMKLCFQLLRLTGDPSWADQMEITLYNALLGAMMPSGDWWAYFSPLAGERMPSPVQVPQVRSSCCVANGPRGLLTVPAWAVMASESGPVVNLYAEGIWRLPLEGGPDVTLTQRTRYPETSRVEIEVRQGGAAEYTLRLRIPAWSETTVAAVNGEPLTCAPGTYLEIRRVWQDGDSVTLDLDLRGRVIAAPGDYNHLAVMRGPVVLALDSRLTEPQAANLWLLHDGLRWKHDDQMNVDYVLLDAQPFDPARKARVALEPCAEKPEGVWMAFEVPFLYRPTHFFQHQKRSLVMVDYASAGSGYSEEDRFRVWLPQPLYLNDAFPTGTWRLLDYSASERPKKGNKPPRRKDAKKSVGAPVPTAGSDHGFPARPRGSAIALGGRGDRAPTGD